MEISASSPSRTHARKLVHWVNSLPLVPCLLVNTLEELRLGDVLDAIVAWLENHTSTEDLNARDCVPRVVAYAAQRCSAADGDAVYIVNSAQCVARVACGDVVAVAAVLTVLRRLAMEKGVSELALAAAQSRATRLQVSRAIQVSHCSEPDNVKVGHAEETRTRSDLDKSQLRMSVAPAPRTKQVDRKSAAQHSENDPLNRNAAAQTARRRPSQSHSNNATTPNESVVKQIITWMDSIGVDCPRTSDHDALRDGVALCRLAAIVTRRRGSIAVRHKLHTVSTPQYPRGVAFPRGATIQPRTRAERRHNVRIAWELLKECRVIPVSAMDLTPEALVDTIDGHTGEWSVWSILSHVQRQMQQLAATPSSQAKASGAVRLVVDEATVRRRPYVTAEQMDVVKRWMKSVGVDPAEVSSGIFEDCLRNGVALWCVLNLDTLYHQSNADLTSRYDSQLLCKRSKRRLIYKDPPKTLLEVRANLHAAISTVASMDEASSIPTVYLTKQAVEGIAIGDKQFIYGLLWHVMQLSKAQDAHASPPPTINEIRAASPPPPPPVEQQHVANTSKPMPLPRYAVAPKVTSLILDVPACQLVEEEDRDRGEIATLVDSRSVPWEATSLMDGEDDIVPIASRRPPRQLAETDDDQLDIVPLQRATPADPSKPTRHSHSANAGDHSMGTESSALQTLLGTRPRVADGALRESTMVQEDGRAPVLDKDAVKTDEAVSPLPVLAIEPVEFSSVQLNQVIQWLKQLGIELTDADAFHNPHGRLSDFTSGVVLCSIVEKLEHMRSMEGVCRHDKIARATALHNIDKAFDVLRRKKMLPIRLLRQKLKIYEGDRTTILSVLLHMRKVRVQTVKTGDRLGSGLNSLAVYVNRRHIVILD